MYACFPCNLERNKHMIQIKVCVICVLICMKILCAYLNQTWEDEYFTLQSFIDVDFEFATLMLLLQYLCIRVDELYGQSNDIFHTCYNDLILIS